MIYTVLVDYPYLEYGDYLFEEIGLSLNKTEKAMETMLSKARTSINVLLDIIPKASLKKEVSLRLYD
jgi:hypothetical protein